MRRGTFGIVNPIKSKVIPICLLVRVRREKKGFKNIPSGEAGENLKAARDSGARKSFSLEQNPYCLSPRSLSFSIFCPRLLKLGLRYRLWAFSRLFLVYGLAP